MAKLAFTKLGLKPNQDIRTIEYNDVMIEVKQYLSVNDKLILISKVINASADNENFANPVKVSVFSALEIVDAYTNLTFTEKQREDPVRLYDLLQGNHLLEQIIRAIPEKEYNEVMTGLNKSIEAIYTYRNSVMGILDAIQTDYSNLNLDATNISEKLANDDNLTFLKELLSKMD